MELKSMKEIKRYLEDRLGKYSFYFEDLKSGYIFGYNEHVKMTSAGCMKLPVAMVVMKEIETGKISLDQMVMVTEKDKVEGSGILKEFLEREYSIRELITVMLMDSDNTATQKLVSILGYGNINSYIQEMGLKNTIMNDMPGSVINLTTSYDLSMCWKHLKNRSYINDENSQLLIDILKKQHKKTKTAFYIEEPLKSRIASKPGDMDGVENDTTLIELQKGDFVFTIMSSELPNSVYGLVSLAKAGKMIWDSIKYNWS